MEQNEQMLAAVRAGDEAKVRELVEADQNLVNAKGYEVSAVLVAMYFNHPALADFLIEQGASLNLFEATATGQNGRVTELLDEQPELVNAYAPDGFTPLTLAAFFDRRQLVEELLARGAAVNQPVANAQKVQPLHSAVAAGRLEISRILLEHGADVNATQQHDFTPLHAAAQNGQLDLVELLLAYGADPTAVTDDGAYPASLALSANHHAVFERLTLPGITYFE